MKALIIEDEPAALERISSLVRELAPEIGTIAQADSVESAAIALLRDTPDIILTDIQLGDGTCFDLFSQAPPQCPVIFITAYNEHALEAFRVNAVDYLLKPLKKEELERALDKFRRQRGSAQAIDYSRLARAILEEEKKYDVRYLIRYGDQIRTISAGEIAYIYTVHKSVFITLHSGKEYPLDKSLDAIEKELDPSKFFRINRQFIVSFTAIGAMHPASKSRVQLELTPAFKGDPVIVSTERSPLFKTWLGDR